MKMNYSDTFGKKPHPSYERQLIDSIFGDLTLFARQDGIETMWSIVDPINQCWENNEKNHNPLSYYKAGTWGPKQASDLLRNDGRIWRFENKLE